MRHRRVPVYRQRRDNVVGVIKEQRLLDLVATRPLADISLDDLIEPAQLVPMTQTVGDLAE